eukprot:jgi/Hompol1/5115/HPOL_004192-RA
MNQSINQSVYATGLAALETIQISVAPVNGSFDGPRTIDIAKNTSVIIGRLVDPNDASNPANALKFTSKVVSRRHAQIVFQDGKLFLQDIKSSSGTFLNEQRLSPQSVESPLFQIKSGDIIRLGEDCEFNGVLHLSITMKLLVHGGWDEADDVGPPRSKSSVSLHSSTMNRMSMNASLNKSGSSFDIHKGMSSEALGGLDVYMESMNAASGDFQSRLEIENEFNAIWQSLTSGLELPLRKVRGTIKSQTANMMSQGIYATYWPAGAAAGGSLSTSPGARQSFLPFPSGSARGSMGSLDGVDMANSGKSPASMRMSRQIIGTLGLTGTTGGGLGSSAGFATQGSIGNLATGVTVPAAYSTARSRQSSANALGTHPPSMKETGALLLTLLGSMVYADLK